MSFLPQDPHFLWFGLNRLRHRPGLAPGGPALEPLGGLRRQLGRVGRRPRDAHREARGRWRGRGGATLGSRVTRGENPKRKQVESWGGSLDLKNDRNWR